MTVPGRVEAAALLLTLDPPAWFLRHARAVAEIAAFLGIRTATYSRTPIDRRLVESAALLHDVDKLVPAADPASALAHGDGSAAWLSARGHAELGPAVAGHPVTRFVEGEADGWLASASHEERIVAYADKRAGQRLESMADRFASWARRYPGAWTPSQAVAARRRSERLETNICAAAGIRPDEVRRLRWTGDAFRAARSSR